MKIINKKAKLNYKINETIEAGMVLTGEEVKSIRQKLVDFAGSYVNILGQEAYLLNLHIGGTNEKNSRRTRKLLLKKGQIINLYNKKKAQGLTLIPTKIYNRRRNFKIEIGLAKARKKFGKRSLLKERDIGRDQERELKDYARSS